MEEGQIRRWATVVENLRSLGHELPHTVREWVARTKEWRPEVVITDFEPLSAAYSRYSRTPLVAVDNINMLDRCHHDEEIVGDEREDFLIAKAVTHSMVPGAVEYVVTTFFEPPIARACTTLVPPIVRPEIEAATPRARRPPGRLLRRRPGADRRAARQRHPLPRLRDARRAGRRRDRRQPRVPPALERRASSRTCGPRGALSPEAASRCSARPSTWASRRWRSRSAGSSSR